MESHAMVKTQNGGPARCVTLELTSSQDELVRIRAFVRKVCNGARTSSVDETRVIQLELAAHEAAANIMKHAYQGRPDQRIVAEGEVSPEGVSIRLYHWGEPFVPGPVRPPALGGLHESGYGLSIIAHSVDEVTYSRDEHGRNCICLVKKLSQEVKGGKKRWN